MQTSKHIQEESMRAGVTLQELLVVVFIVGLLAAMLLPAIQQSRAAARRAQCLNNQKQIGIAVHQYVDVHRVLPPWGFLYPILPFMEEAPLYNASEPGLNGTTEERGQTIMSLPILAKFTCPEDRYIHEPGGASYCINRGLVFKVFGAQLAFIPETPSEPLRWEDVSDGLSQTVLASEWLSSPPYQFPALPPPPFVTYRIAPAVCDYRNLGGYAAACNAAPTTIGPTFGRPSGNLMSGNGGYDHVNTPNQTSCISLPSAQCLIQAIPPSSGHHQGVHVLLADGSARFVADGISGEIWRGIGSRNGREVVGEF